MYPNIGGHEAISFGIATLSAYLRKMGHEIHLMDYTWGGKIDDCVKKVKESKTDLVGFSVRSGVFRFCVRLAKELRSNFDIPIIFGGVHPTVAPEECIAEESVDMICIGEGELALAELLNKMDKGVEIRDTGNLWFKKRGEIIRNPVRPLIKDLDKLPIIDRELFKYETYCEANAGTADIIVSRGCPFSCTYCINPFLSKLYGNSYRHLRYHSVDYVLGEISSLVENYPVKSIFFRDDIFPPSTIWLREFAEKYPKNFNIPFLCGTRVELVTREVCTLLKNANCFYLGIGIESGSEKIRREVLNRPMTNQQIVDAFRTAKEAGLNVGSFNMVGLPLETKKEMQETVALNRKVKPDLLAVSIFTPYPGTELQKWCKQRGWIKKCDIPSIHRAKSIMKYPQVSGRNIVWWWKTFRFRVFLRSNIYKAFLLLLFDMMLYEVYTSIRPRLPKLYKKLLSKAEQWMRE